jgi:hypothetical protein
MKISSIAVLLLSVGAASASAVQEEQKSTENKQKSFLGFLTEARKLKANIEPRLRGNKLSKEELQRELSGLSEFLDRNLVEEASQYGK